MQASTEQLWVEMSDSLRRFIARRVSDADTAEDILQEAFLKIHSNIASLKDDEKLQSWIYMIARNVINDHYRSSKPTTELPEPELLAMDEDEESVAQQLIPSVKAMVAQLPPRYRQAIVLSEYSGLTQREVGERLGISLSGAKSRVQRAREKLKEMLLDCCHFELDRQGRIIDYQPRCECCQNGQCDPKQA